MRFDPAVDDQPVVIAGMRLLDDRGEMLLRMDPRTFRPVQQIQSITTDGEGVRIQPTPKADDPILRLDLGPMQKRMHEAMGRRTVGRGTVAGLGLGLGAMLMGAVIVAWRALGKSGALLGGAAVFLVVFGARLLALHLFGRPVPFWDEWEGDALYVVIPFVGGFLDWGAMIMPQWEHRILLTRTITLFGTLLNGEWDPRVAMTVSAALYSAAIALIGTALVATRRAAGVIGAFVLAGCAALPYDVNNLFWGGQTQMYGLLLMAICSIALAAAPRIALPVQLAGSAAGLLSLFTMGAGPVGTGVRGGDLPRAPLVRTRTASRARATRGDFLRHGVARRIFAHELARARAALRDELRAIQPGVRRRARVAADAARFLGRAALGADGSQRRAHLAASECDLARVARSRNRRVGDDQRGGARLCAAI